MKVGKKPKFKQGVKTKVISPIIPINKEPEILKAIKEICKDDLFIRESSL